MTLKQLYPLHLLLSNCYGKALGGSSGADMGRWFHYENIMSTALIFLIRTSQRQIGVSFIKKKLYPLHIFLFDC